MAQDKVIIANKAFAMIGSQAITSFDDTNSNEAIAINNVYDDILREVLSDHPWAFAQKRHTLVPVVPADVSRTIDEEVFTPLEITAATVANPVVITSAAHGLQNQDKIIIQGVSGMTELNGNTYYVASKTNDTITLNDVNGDDIDGSAFTTWTSGGQIFKATAGTPIIITAATQASPVEITSAAHGLSDGDWIKIIGVAGMTDLNGSFFIVDDVTTNTFTLDVSSTTESEVVDVDGTGFSAFTYGGRVYEAIEMIQIDTRASAVVVYQKPTDYVKLVKKSIQWATVNVEQDKIISDVTDLLIVYTYFNVTVSQYFPKFVQAFATRLASEVAFTIMNSVSKSKELRDLYQNVDLPIAISVDSTEGSPDEVMDDEWIRARLQGTFPATTGSGIWHPV